MNRFGVAWTLALISSVSLSGCGDLLGSSGGEDPPSLVSVEPLDGESGVSVCQPVSARFSKRPTVETMEAGITLLNGARPVVTGYTLGQGDKEVTLAPPGALDFGTTYRVEVTGLLGFRDSSTFPSPTSWEFSTEGLPLPQLDQDSLFVHLEALAHDSMEGRASGGEDELRAAEYLRERFLAYGLQEPPGGVIQSFEAMAWRLDQLLTSRNVLAAVEGSGSLADEWVVIGAHYDHIGYRNLADESQGPNNGADDNASGTVLVLEMARQFQAFVDQGGTGTADRRSVLFALFGAEEQGLLGSCAYVHESPAVPLDRTVAMMNFDMVGRVRDNTVYISGAETSDLWADMVGNANHPELGLFIRESSCTGCTDHVCFWQAGIPFVGFYTGSHPEYHSPADDVETINFPGIVRVGDLAFRVLSRLVVMPDPPVLTGGYPGAP